MRTGTYGVSIIQRFVGATLISLAMAACGGGGSSGAAITTPNLPVDPVGDTPALTGILFDSEVGGIGYRTATQTGVTNDAGEFSYLEGESITFFVGDLELPAVLADGMVTPLDIAASDDPGDQFALNIARLLQSLDSDGNPENGITIPAEAAAAAAGLTVDFQTDGASFASAVANFVASAGGQLVSEEQALNHLTGSLLRLALEGATLIGIDSLNGINLVVVATFRSDGTLEDVNNDDFDEPYDFETNSHRANIWQGTWTLDGDRVCTIDSDRAEDCWYMSVSGDQIHSYNDEAKTDLVFSDTVARRIDTAKLPGTYRYTFPRYEDECNLQIDCYLDFAANGALVRRATGEPDENATWEVDDHGNLRLIFFNASGITDGDVRVFVKNATGQDAYQELDGAIYVDGIDQEFAVLVAATLTRVE